MTTKNIIWLLSIGFILLGLFCNKTISGYVILSIDLLFILIGIFFMYRLRIKRSNNRKIIVQEQNMEDVLMSEMTTIRPNISKPKTYEEHNQEKLWNKHRKSC